LSLPGGGGEIDIDATAGTFEPEPWLIFHDQDHIVFFDSDQDQWFQHDLYNIQK